MDEVAQTHTLPELDIEVVVEDILSAIDREREREIISRRYGLYDRRETLEQIGELLGITRERVRQLEKTVIGKLAEVAETDLPSVKQAESAIVSHVSDIGGVAKIKDLAERFKENASKIDHSRLSFIVQLSPNLTHVSDNDRHHAAASLKSKHSEKSVRENINNVIDTVKKIGKPVNIKEVAGAMGHPDHKEVEALASVSKKLATLNKRWGLIKWPTVNPKNIRDKIYVILYENGKQMHFNDIAKSIRDSDFKRRDVTTQAIHNELIKDKRFILVGRGIYALKEWGFSQGTVAEVIADVLKDADEPLHRDEIVKRVLKRRFVKETTILLNLQGKPQFKRTAKATYAYEEPVAVTSSK